VADTIGNLLCQPRKPLCAFQISNTGKDTLASNRRIVYLWTGNTKMTPVCLPDPSEDETFLRLHHAELRELLTKAILLLPEQERLVFTLHYYERLTTEEIKQVLGVTESRISRLHVSALSRLHASLADRAHEASRVVAKTGRTIQ
jgi:RNA polymerase sigma factor (sigma-70 family)